MQFNRLDGAKAEPRLMASDDAAAKIAGRPEFRLSPNYLLRRSLCQGQPAPARLRLPTSPGWRRIKPIN